MNWSQLPRAIRRRLSRPVATDRSSERRGRRSSIGVSIQPGLVAAAQCEYTAHGPKLLALAEVEVPIDAQPAEIGRHLATLIDAHPYQGCRAVALLGLSDVLVQSIRVPRASGDELEAIVRSETADRLPIAPQDCEVRFLPAAEVRHEDGVRQEVLLLACRRDVIDRQLDILATAGLEPVALDLEAAATLRALDPGASSRGPLANDAAGLPILPHRGIISLTRQSLSLTLVENGRILFAKHLAGGGYELDRAIADAMDFPLSEATRLRNSIAGCRRLDRHDDVHRALADAIARPLESMSRELELCLRYHKITFRRELASLELVGSEAAGWLADSIAVRLGIDCPLGELGLDAEAGVGSSARQGLRRPSRWIAPIGAALRPRSAAPGDLVAGDATPTGSDPETAAEVTA